MSYGPAHPIIVGLLALLLVLPSAASAVAQDATPVPLPVSDAFEEQADVAEADALFAWSVTRAEAAWEVQVSGPEGESVRFDLERPDGSVIDSAKAPGAATLLDLALQPGAYVLRVPRSSPDVSPVSIAARAAEGAFDAEPNDDPTAAAPIEIGSELEGRLAGDRRDIDTFSFQVDRDDELLDIRLDDPAAVGRELCLLDREGADRQCRNGSELALSDLALEPGEHRVQVSGSNNPDAPYTLALAWAGERRPDREAEPNDDPTTADAFDPELGLDGQAPGSDRDYHIVTLDGAPLLWRIEATGPDLRELAWVDGGGSVIEVTDAAETGEPLVLTDLLLGAGRHRFLTRTYTGSYRLEATPLGPPDPDAEHEPNSDPVRAEAYTIGERVVGRLPTSDDLDYLRFTLAAPERLRLRLIPAADADIDIRLETGGTELLRQWPVEPGAPLEIDLALPAGDHQVRFAPRRVSEEPYEFTLERIDPWAPIADLEPNGRPAFARAAPAELRWSGDGEGNRDEEWYGLPPLDTQADLVVRISGDAGARLFAGAQGEERIQFERGEEGEFIAPAVPPDVPLYLQLTAVGPYEVEVSSSGLTPGAPVPASAVAAELIFDVDEVAAYRPEEQHVMGRLTLTNGGSADAAVELTLESSDPRWVPMIGMERQSLAPGEETTVDIDVAVGPDAWAGAPVRIAVGAIEPSGAHATATAELIAAAEVAPVDPRPGWRMPEALLGGLNVAALGLGAEPAGTVRADIEPFLYDGLIAAGGGFYTSVDSFPVEFVVELAGDEPMPIVGTILDPRGRGGLADRPDRFEVLLSDDGETWTSVLSGRLSSAATDQAFVLDTPMAATHAMLRIDSLHVGSSRTVALGEWHVIAEPGIAPADLDRNIADPARGGRVLRRTPPGNSWGEQTEGVAGETKRVRLATDRLDPRFDITIGFQDGRAAQVESLRWIDPEGSVPEDRLDRVEVQVSTESPLGPWTELGDWDLGAAATGEALELRFDESRWIRFLRLSSPLPEGTRNIELPAAIEVIERPTDAEYRSVLGAWGNLDQHGPYEFLEVTHEASVALDEDAGDERADATSLAFGTLHTDRATILEDVDWYRFDVPSDANTLAIDVRGIPDLAVGLTLVDSTGAELLLEGQPLPDGRVRYEAAVTPGQPYDLLVEQLPFSVVFTFDTSGSIGPLLPAVMEGVREFVADIRPGRESVFVQPFVPAAPLLAGWSDDPNRLVDAVNAFDGRKDSSSAAVDSMLAAATKLLGREGRKAILVITDAETGGLDLRDEVWNALEAGRPIVHSVHVGGESNPLATRNLMQSWAYANEGRYVYPTTQADLDRSYERISAQLRRPATYALEASAAFVDRSPGTISVVAPAGAAAPLAPGVGVEIILDTSGSMRDKLGGQRRIAIAKASLRELLSDGLAEGVPVALRTFDRDGKGRSASCRTRLTQPLAPLERAAALQLVKGLQAKKGTRTPIAAALSAVADDLAGVTGSRTVVLITDGDETCDGDPEAAIAALIAAGIEVNLNIVGFALEDEELKGRMAGWAEVGGGSYFDAAGADELAAALTTAVAAPYRIFAADDEEPLASGTVGDAGVTLDPGTYQVEVLTDPPISFEDVELLGGGSVSLQIPEVPA